MLRTMSMFYKRAVKALKGSSPSAEKPMQEEQAQSQLRSPEQNGGLPQFGHSNPIYGQILFWLAEYLVRCSEATGMHTDALIEEFGVNVRRVINPDWRPDA